MNQKFDFKKFERQRIEDNGKQYLNGEIKLTNLN